MPNKLDHNVDPSAFRSELEDRGPRLRDLWGCMFEGQLIYVDHPEADDQMRVNRRDTVFRVKQACDIARFAGAQLTDELKEGVTHVIVGNDQEHNKVLRRTLSRYAYGEKAYMVVWPVPNLYSQFQAPPTACHSQLDRAELEGEDAPR